MLRGSKHVVEEVLHLLQTGKHAVCIAERLGDRSVLTPGLRFGVEVALEFVLYLAHKPSEPLVVKRNHLDLQLLLCDR